MRISTAMLVLLLPAFPAASESLEFSIYRLVGEDQELIASGKRDYSASDVNVREWGSNEGHPSWKKTLDLKDGFNLGIVVIRGNDLTSGFGIWIANDHHPEGFSWEWFEPEYGDVFKKLQGEGYVRATLGQCPDGVEIQSVEFLTDITLRFKDDVSMDPPEHKTHKVVVSQGSVFSFAP